MILEAFHAQFEVLRMAQHWLEESRTLQLAMYLTDDALSCLLMLDAKGWKDYKECTGGDLLCTELNR